MEQEHSNATEKAGTNTVSTDDSYYDIHVFVCTNRRSNSKSCGGNGSERLLRHAKRRVRQIEGPTNISIRVNSSGCLGRCELGPLIVIYPDSTWYHCRTPYDLDEIITSHI
ncbi:MAG TPA: (2Fe-2S) ferredoxin domain-containing protein, partial [Gammaproteobacteria bacterium]|nr:(2Fe-2S) ferredoxin domain-containing protein [Gammaproteobacteria bacterium]